eukprot:COSAG02_NODE_64775_length_259_cov_1.281250_1_plen_53_part_01
MCGKVSWWIVARVLVVSPPLVTRRSQFVCCQGAATRCEGACDDDGLLSIPFLV